MENFSIVDNRGNITGVIRKSYPVKFVNPEREYDVNYLAPHQSLKKQREEGFFYSKRKRFNRKSDMAIIFVRVDLKRANNLAQ